MIEVKNIEKQYGAQKVLNGLSLRISEGEFVSIMGKSGSGKSTLLSIMAGLTRPDSGEVLFDGRDMAQMKDAELARLRCTKLGFVYQFFNLIPTLTAEDNILLPYYIRKEKIAPAKARMGELVSYLGIEGALGKYPETLSGGEQQRVAIARTLLYEPRVLMLDEPTGNLDTATTVDIMELLRKLNTERGVTIVQVTHSPEAATFGTRTLYMKDGQMVDEDIFKTHS